MTTSQIFFITLLVLTTFFITTLASHDHDQDHHNPPLATVHITNVLPQNNSNNPMKIRCNCNKKYFGYKTLACGEDYTWIAEERDLYFCEALWGRFMASWHAFQPKRDINQQSVFWLVKQNGFFLSWDNSTWVKKSIWETE